ncbi:GNAT family N-acetyltransferase [Microlunatus soli]|uniref:Predicted acetyltransferase n=1 Tax=Microlunatus soli TaxID=630515 RepID=A0A1H1QR32_9ACTN|nr:GNAT family N-acetyltransferase [Microlunatus soli]SDS25952.1 Predicted acetyltransferase [Microlunatus soli]
MTTDNSARRVDVRPADHADRELLTSLWMLFHHDLSAFTDAYPDERGRYRTDRLDSAFDDPHWMPYVIRTDRRPAGLAVVRRADQVPHVLTAFFLVKPARRRGIGTTAAQQVIRRHPGPWEIAFQPSNAGAAAFWRRLAETVAAGRWREEQRDVPDRHDLPPDSWIIFDPS